MTSLPIKPSDARAWSECSRRVWLDNKGDVEVVPEEDAFAHLIIERGLQHEAAVLEQLSDEYDVVHATSEKQTRDLMADGVDLIYQGELSDSDLGLLGKPDFIIRTENGDYQAADAKLSLSADKKEIQVQIGAYRRLLNTDRPGIVFLGNGEQVELADEVDKVTDRFLVEMRSLLDDDDEPEAHYAHSKCQACPYYSYCLEGFESADDLSLIYGVQGRSANGLVAQGIPTISELAKSDPADISDVPYLKGDKKGRAVLQAKASRTGEYYQIHPITLPDGVWVHFDIEDNPLTNSGEKHVYLWGFLEPAYRQDNFCAIWTDSDTQDYDGWLAFLEKIEEYRRRYSDWVLAHYSRHERTTIEAYAKRYGMEDNQTVQYLLGDDSPLFDIQEPIKESLVLPLKGYGLKDVCKHPELVNFQWEDEGSGSQWSIVQFNNFLSESDLAKREVLKAAILGYNRDDVVATRRLEEWLREKFLQIT